MNSTHECQPASQQHLFRERRVSSLPISPQECDCLGALIIIRRGAHRPVSAEDVEISTCPQRCRIHTQSLSHSFIWPCSRSLSIDSARLRRERMREKNLSKGVCSFACQQLLQSIFHVSKGEFSFSGALGFKRFVIFYIRC